MSAPSISARSIEARSLGAKVFWPLIAASITVALFLLMGYLITPTGEVPQEEAETSQVVITRTKREESSDTKPRPKPKKPEQEITPPPPSIPRPKPQAASNNNALVVEIPNIGTDTALSNTSGDRRATPIVRIPPQYPQSALSKGTQGWVLLEFTITHTGTVENIQVVDAEPARIFNRAAIRAIKRWKYQPKIANGKAVPQQNMREIFRFEIQDS